MRSRINFSIGRGSSSDVTPQACRTAARSTAKSVKAARGGARARERVADAGVRCGAPSLREHATVRSAGGGNLYDSGRFYGADALKALSAGRGGGSGGRRARFGRARARLAVGRCAIGDDGVEEPELRRRRQRRLVLRERAKVLDEDLRVAHRRRHVVPGMGVSSSRAQVGRRPRRRRPAAAGATKTPRPRGPAPPATISTRRRRVQTPFCRRYSTPLPRAAPLPTRGASRARTADPAAAAAAAAAAASKAAVALASRSTAVYIREQLDEVVGDLAVGVGEVDLVVEQQVQLNASSRVLRALLRQNERLKRRRRRRRRRRRVRGLRFKPPPPRSRPRRPLPPPPPPPLAAAARAGATASASLDE